MIDRSSLELAWSTEENDSTTLDHLLPPLHHLLTTSASGESGLILSAGTTSNRITITAHIDPSNPLTEARWVKTGEVDLWISTLAIENKTALSEWIGKLSISDPDPVSLFLSLIFDSV